MNFEQTHIPGCFDEMRSTGKGFMVVSNSTVQSFNSPSGSFWVGVYPGMTEEMVGYMVDTIEGFICR